MFLSEWRKFPSAPCLAEKKKLDDSSCLHVVESHASRDMLPFSLCNKKRLAIRQTPLSNDTIDSVLRRWEVGRAKDLSAPPRICLFSCLMRGTQYESYCRIFCIILILSFTKVEMFRNYRTNLCLCVERKVNKQPPMNMTSVLPTPSVRWCW